MTLKIVSGAQTGADVAGLWAAKLFKIPTGGLAPKGFITLNGPKPEMAATFGILEHEDAGYRARTKENLKSSTATLVCSEKMSPGTKLTIDQCKKLHVPLYVMMLDPSDMAGSIDQDALTKLTAEINRNKLLGIPFVLNVAGNATQNSERSFEFAFKVCYQLFTKLGYTSDVQEWEWVYYKDRWK